MTAKITKLMCARHPQREAMTIQDGNAMCLHCKNKEDDRAARWEPSR